MRITSLGHACLLVEIADSRVLIDPGSFSRGFEDQRDLDAVVLTHQHADHLDRERFPGLLQRNPQATVLVESQVHDLLSEQGIDSATLHGGERVDLGAATLTGVGALHAEVHPFTPRIGNVGVVLTAAGEPTLFHPGDAYDGEPGQVDVLALPLSAPWAKVAETLAFAGRVRPRVAAVPIHDGTLSAAGRGMYLQHVGSFGGPAGSALRVEDLAGGQPWAVGSG